MDRPERRTPARALTGAVIVGALLALAVVGLVRSSVADGPQTREERAHAVATSLRCPTCQGLSVADSGSPLAQSMRRIIDEQVAAGRSEGEVRGYFVQRYGDWVLLAPPARGAGWLVWLLPALAVLVGLAAASRLVRRERASLTLRWVAVGGVLATALGVLLSTSLDDRGEGELATGNVTPLGSGASGSDAAPPQRPADGGPTDTSATSERLALAATAFDEGRLAVVREQADAVLADDPDNVDALMLRGLAATSADDPRANAALRRFLDLAPSGHPAVPLVRGLLEDRR